jgi:hypothetical protein
MLERLVQGINYFGAQISTFKPGWMNRSHVAELIEADRAEKARVERQLSRLSPELGQVAARSVEYDVLTEDQILQRELIFDFWAGRNVPGIDVEFLEVEETGYLR